MKDTEDLRFCRGCLLGETPQGLRLRAGIEEYIRLLPEAQRASDAEYRRRLSLCKQCDQLFGGTCRLCGCFVEARAAKAGMRYPSLPPAW